MSLIERLNALNSTGTPQESTEPSANAEEHTEQNEGQPETPDGDTQSKLDRRRKVKLGDVDLEIEVLTDDPDLLDLVPKGLLMQADYTKKTMEVAEQRKEVESKIEALRSTVKDLEASLNTDIEDLETDEMKALKDEDDPEYWRAFKKAQSKSDKLKKAKEKLAKQDAEQFNQFAKKELELWNQSVPEWLDTDVRTRELKQISDSLKTAGFADEEISNFFDHRLIKQLRKAMLYEEVKAQKIQSSPKAPKAPKTIEQTTADRAKETTAYQKSREQLKKSGTRRDAQAAIKKLLGG